MTNIAHKDITGANIHEPKGADAASVGTVYVSDGAGSGAWSALLPIGFVADFAGSATPSKWLLCYGQPINRSTYSALFSAIGTTYGIGDGSTTFNLPDCRGRVSAGKDNMGGVSADRLTGAAGGVGTSPNGDNLGATGGSETESYTQQGSFASGLPSTTGTADGYDGGSFINIARDNHGHFTDISGQTVASSNVQPTIIFNKIIYTGV